MKKIYNIVIFVIFILIILNFVPKTYAKTNQFETISKKQVVMYDVKTDLNTEDIQKSILLAENEYSVGDELTVNKDAKVLKINSTSHTTANETLKSGTKVIYKGKSGITGYDYQVTKKGDSNIYVIHIKASDVSNKETSENYNKETNNNGNKETETQTSQENQKNNSSQSITEYVEGDILTTNKEAKVAIVDTSGANGAKYTIGTIESGTKLIYKGLSGVEGYDYKVIKKGEESITSKSIHIKASDVTGESSANFTHDENETKENMLKYKLKDIYLYLYGTDDLSEAVTRIRDWPEDPEVLAHWKSLLDESDTKLGDTLVDIIEEETVVKDDAPDLLLAKDSAEHTPDEIIGEAKDFGTYTGETKIKGNNLLNSSKTLTNILMVVSIGVAVIVGSMMGIRIMIASAEEKASIKESMIPYLFGAFIAFGAFAIWNVFITIFQSVE